MFGALWLFAIGKICKAALALALTDQGRELMHQGTQWGPLGPVTVPAEPPGLMSLGSLDRSLRS